MPTNDRRLLTLSGLIEQSLSPLALGFLLRLTHYFRNEPITINQVLDLFDVPTLSHLSNADKYDVIDQLVAKEFIHRYAFLGTIKYQSTLELIPIGAD